MPVCSFCRRRYKEPRGLTVFSFDGRSIFYCSGKCRKNMEHLGRDPKKTNWVKKRAGFLEGTEEIAEKVSEKEDSSGNISEKKEEEKKEKNEKKK